MGTSKKDIIVIDLSKIGAIILQARLHKGISQEQLALKSGTTKAMINKIETEADNVKIAVIRNVIENGLGGQMQLTVEV